MRVAMQTLYAQTDGTTLRLQHDTVLATMEKQTLLQIPLQHVQSIVAIGRVSITSPLLERCAKDGKSVVRMNGQGRFLYRLEGPRSGNVLLRIAQFQAVSHPEKLVPLVQSILSGKLHNTRQTLLRSARDSRREESKERLRDVADDIARDLRRLPYVTDLNALRGVEGINAKRYFSVFEHQFTQWDSPVTRFHGRSRRPPRDPVNCLLSFLYALLHHDAMSAIESVGLDPQIGFLHTLRPGRASLALDLMEEVRSVLADRLAITLINRRQIQTDDFEFLPGGAVSLSESGRKTVLSAYQMRKREEFQHPLLEQRLALGDVLPVQARLLARAVRRDHLSYIPFYFKA
ncbi:type I-C CRISPR-associated endonuclease Cas1c [Alicyclobacillus sp. SP_1]|uniref:type I-C CRISPR-associated endonuclease Cas1c n=1 Tax=Alicyclobacillus sp. SP_1 TaxID=2942475 RepID=UPI0021575058|nr:type I-C CRISPR-associated endonuclease Cas1c [Alicyclobacillus sp. SP_1]